MKQEERRQQTLLLLLESVKALIAEKGCDALTMNDIMQRSGLSKGAIFHYVKSKDELFVLVLEERLNDVNRRFTAQVAEQPAEFAGPFGQITQNLHQLQDPADLTNQVLLYLLGKSSQQLVAELLDRFHQTWVRLAESWIAAGQQHGVIGPGVPARQTAELFVLLSLGLRMRSALPAQSFAFDTGAFTGFLANMLHNGAKPPASSESAHEI